MISIVDRGRMDFVAWPRRYRWFYKGIYRGRMDFEVWAGVAWPWRYGGFFKGISRGRRDFGGLGGGDLAREVR